jgi:hypothetical protein
MGEKTCVLHLPLGAATYEYGQIFHPGVLEFLPGGKLRPDDYVSVTTTAIHARIAIPNGDLWVFTPDGVGG